MVQVIPAVLAKTPEEFAGKIAFVLPYCQRIQIDIMDGAFVPNMTVGESEKVKAGKLVVLEYHLMVKDPVNYIEKIGNKNAVYIFHVEAVKDPSRIIEYCKSRGLKVGIALNPDTNASEIEPYAASVCMALFMTVVPGFSGQKYIKTVESKIMEFRAKHPHLDIEVDGGVGLENIRGAARAGANLLACASAIFGQQDAKAAMEDLRKAATS